MSETHKQHKCSYADVSFNSDYNNDNAIDIYGRSIKMNKLFHTVTKWPVIYWREKISCAAAGKELIRVNTNTITEHTSPYTPRLTDSYRHFNIQGYYYHTSPTTVRTPRFGSTKMYSLH